jgi:4-diphosphocytidyl-2C-methyl-D-erythritol kinase
MEAAMGRERYPLSPGREKPAAVRHKEARTVMAWLMNTINKGVQQQTDALLSANRVPCQAGSPNHWLTTSGATVCRGGSVVAAL